MPARVSTELPADALRALAGSLEDGDGQAPAAGLAVNAVRNLARYAPAGKRVRLWIEWQTPADVAEDLNNGCPVAWDGTDAPGGYVCAAPEPKRPGGTCGVPVESKPCPEHAGPERDRPRYSRADLEEAYQYGLAAAPATAPATYPGPQPG